MVQMFHQVMLVHAHRLEQQRATEFVRLAAPRGGHALAGLWKGTYGAHGIEVVQVRLGARASSALRLALPRLLGAALGCAGLPLGGRRRGRVGGPARLLTPAVCLLRRSRRLWPRATRWWRPR
jgi:hypothetical protein